MDDKERVNIEELFLLFSLFSSTVWVAGDLTIYWLGPVRRLAGVADLNMVRVTGGEHVCSCRLPLRIPTWNLSTSSLSKLAISLKY